MLILTAAINETRVVTDLARSDTPNITLVVSRVARSDTPNITLVVSRVARSDTPNRGDAMSALHAQPASPIKYIGLTQTVLSSSWQDAYSYIQQSCHSVKSMNAKNHRFMRMRTRT